MSRCPLCIAAPWPCFTCRAIGRLPETPQTIAPPPTKPPRLDTLGWDDGRLWLDADAADYLRCTVADLDAVVAKGAPVIDIGVPPRRWNPSALQAWVAGLAPTSTKKPLPRRHTRAGSGFSQQP